MEIINYTHYNTDDIKKIVDFVALRPEFTSWGTDKLVIKEFNPKNPYESRRHRYNASMPSKKYTSKMRWAARSELSLLVPSKIYENPLEALSQGDDELAPADMVRAVILAVRDRANTSGYHRDGREMPTGGLTLRVMSKVEQRRPKSTGDLTKARMNYARRNIGIPAWDARKAIKVLSAGRSKNLKAARSHLKGKGSMVDPIEQALNEAINALGRLVAECENARNVLS